MTNKIEIIILKEMMYRDSTTLPFIAKALSSYGVEMDKNTLKAQMLSFLSRGLIVLLSEKDSYVLTEEGLSLVKSPEDPVRKAIDNLRKNIHAKSRVEGSLPRYKRRLIPIKRVAETAEKDVPNAVPMVKSTIEDICQPNALRFLLKGC